MPRYEISHKTMYGYAAPVIQSHHLLHLAPRPVGHQKVLRHALFIEPAPAWNREITDYFGNPSTLIAMEEEHKSLVVQAVSEIDVDVVQPPKFSKSPAWEDVASGVAAPLTPSIAEFTCRSRHVRLSKTLYDFARSVFADRMPVLEGARLLTEKIFNEFQFDNSTTDVSTPVETVLKQRSGVCQDFAHLQIAALRSLGLPVRYISGYILTHPPEGEKKLEGSDASHAWVAVWSPDCGWVHFDPTNNLTNSPEHITIAHGRDFEDVSPINGVLLGGGQHSVSVAVNVKPLAA